RPVRSVRLQPDQRERRVPRFERALVCNQSARHLVSVATAQTNHTNAAAPRRRRDGDDGVSGGKHALLAEIRTFDAETAEAAEKQRPTISQRALWPRRSNVALFHRL